MTVLKSLRQIAAEHSTADRACEVEALFVGAHDGMEKRLAEREGVAFTAIEAGAMHGVGARRAARGAWHTARGAWSAWRLIGAYRPDVVLLTGGFVGVPVSLAAWLRRTPSVVYLPDIEPGLALKVMARLANRVAVTSKASAAFIPRNKMVVTGYPVREAFTQTTRNTARARFNLPSDAKVLLVFGGSIGARSINQALLGAIDALLSIPTARILHITGQRDWPAMQTAHQALPGALRERYLIFPYLHDEMADALAAADLVVCRSGASALGELTSLGLPAVLVPYPHAWRYQRVNAHYLAERGAAVVLEDAELNNPQHGLAQVAVALLNDPSRLAAMQEASRRLGASLAGGARRIAEIVWETGQRYAR
ncbi:MAG: UDP-N-acetylglucosamine--N-acetylmuramyl-(pentapeptide) pyrophosphoryl-undecaprenol N-acetylglucosamine transferase [Anaerolineae bacterium]|nr:UDP-N-acetylglucosamine--N-acetylmuramyl-(pentapeptide) pyrophosphoryl-undecaprenol N-acetylglucosamine transferase [Thermoflexales bacterium]MDW8406693.1 UDP-N-acetylglucosamine--N-acetylmuramyl-(pentapeptide) pyrophosphoryl-undecaprenol N-acetylglucosamine transferase [Anaerolineae bacterium]